MAIGIGVYAGLGSTATWRRLSNDASFAATGMHDLQVTLSPGTFADQGVLEQALASIADAAAVAASEERLVVDNQVDASTATDSVLVPARIVGMSFDANLAVDAAWVQEGTMPGPNDQAGLLEAKFADSWALPPSGMLIIAGNQTVRYTGLATIPEDFFYQGPEGSILSEGELAPLYLPLSMAQELTKRPGEVNDLVLTLVADADRDLIQRQLTNAVAELGVSATVSTRDDAEAVQVLYDDIENDQRFWNALAGLVLGAAALAAFNLISRIVEAQRREIGIGMALGVPKWKLAIRPLLVGVQVALLGTMVGIGVGLLVGQAMEDLLKSVLPMPDYRTPFQFDVFAKGAALGLAIPILASVLPLWRALRVEPIEAIRTGHLTAKTSRLTDWTGRIRLPGSSLSQIPLRNIMRTPRRTFLTAAGVGAAITALVAVLGLLDSFGRTIDQAGSEFTNGDEDRVLVQLDTFYPADSDVVTAISKAPSIGSIDIGLRLPATGLATSPGDDLDFLVEFVDFEHGTWTPTIEESVPGSGIILARKAATDLRLGLGDTLTLRHPKATGPATFALVESELTVIGIHANPLRTFAYLPLDSADVFGLEGAANIVHAYHAVGASRSDVQSDLFDSPGVSSSQAVARISEGFNNALEQFVGILFIAAAAVLLLALLIAFNASRITVDERRREYATMRAFGLPVRSIMWIIVKESVIIGLVATIIGIVAGALFLSWMLRSLASTTLPDLGIATYISPVTMVIAAAVGVLAVAIAPLFLTGRIRRMDIPDTLRVME